MCEQYQKIVSNAIDESVKGRFKLMSAHRMLSLRRRIEPCLGFEWIPLRFDRMLDRSTTPHFDFYLDP